MTVTHSIVAGQLEQRELQSMVSMLCARFPDTDPTEIAQLVTDVYYRLRENARIRSHLIPLTLNRCRQILSGPPIEVGLTAAAV
ncbi:hypothetical protein BH09ACT7_BH09ACT7_32790 [soil metagenome]